MARNSWMFFVVAVSLASSFAFAKSTPPFKSKEDIEFVSKAEAPIMTMYNTAELQGIVTRIYEKDVTLKYPDVYAFQDAGKIKMDKVLCEKYLIRIMGPLDKISPKMKKMDLFKTSTGYTCDVQMVDESKDRDIIPERRILIGLINAKPYGLVFNLKKKSDASVEENIHKFWQGLR